MEKKRRPKSLVIALLVLTIGAIGTAVYLWRQNVELRSRIPAGPASANDESVRRVREGDELPEFTAPNTDGRNVRVAARGEGNTLLFIYSPSCDRCEAAMSGWAKVNDKLKRLKAGVHVIGLSIEDSYSTVQHARRVKIPFTTVPFPNIELQKRYGATEVPLTLVLDSRGIVRALWDKPLDDGEVGDVIETACPECLNRAATRPLSQ
ncbi:MAG TPA: redoxin domain-containing protein [Blastocatellia bacterium]|nr:redoxin domain-containing protein [Blastocatellia bacterium]